MIAVGSQAGKVSVGAQKHLLDKILYIHRSIPAPLSSQQPPKVSEDFIVVLLD
jgi:hypothetical protein